MDGDGHSVREDALEFASLSESMRSILFRTRSVRLSAAPSSLRTVVVVV
jgi:hypothetical protein